MLAGLLFALVLVPFRVIANEALWAKLEAGGQVVLMRHAVTTPGVGDPPGMRLDDCATQRNLTDEGRRHARRTGEAFRVPRRRPSSACFRAPGAVASRPRDWRSASKAQKPDSLSNLFGRPENRVAAGRRAATR